MLRPGVDAEAEVRKAGRPQVPEILRRVARVDAELADELQPQLAVQDFRVQVVEGLGIAIDVALVEVEGVSPSRAMSSISSATFRGERLRKANRSEQKRHRPQLQPRLAVIGTRCLRSNVWYRTMSAHG